MASPDGGRDVRVGDRERESAQAALAEHLAAGRLDLDEYTERVDRCLAARTRRELLALFDDLPQPLPELVEPTASIPGGATPSPAADTKDVPTATNESLDAALGMAIVPGIPAAVVLGFAYDAWWTLAIPASASVLLMVAQAIINHRAQNR